MVVALLDMVPYVAFVDPRRMSGVFPSIVLGITNRYTCIDRGNVFTRFAVFEEFDCSADPSTFVAIAREASAEVFGEDLVAMVVATRKGFHVYLDLWTTNFFESLLYASRFRNAAPCACRDERHVALAIELMQRLRWPRYILRVSNTKHINDVFQVVYRKPSRDPCHEAFLREVERLYRAPPAL